MSKQKKDFTGADVWATGDTVQDESGFQKDAAEIEALGKRVQDVTSGAKKRGPKPGARRGTFGDDGQIVTIRARKDVFAKIIVIARREGMPLQVVIDQAFRAAVDKYEAKHGALDEESERREAEAEAIARGENVLF